MPDDAPDVLDRLATLARLWPSAEALPVAAAEIRRLRAEVRTLRARNAELEGPAEPDYGPPADPGCDPAMVETALLLVDDDAPPPDVIASWTPEQRRAVAEWARREHLHASDHPGVARLPRPDVLPPAPGWGQTRTTRR